MLYRTDGFDWSGSTFPFTDFDLADRHLHAAPLVRHETVRNLPMGASGKDRWGKRSLVLHPAPSTYHPFSSAVSSIRRWREVGTPSTLTTWGSTIYHSLSYLVPPLQVCIVQQGTCLGNWHSYPADQTSGLVGTGTRGCAYAGAAGAPYMFLYKTCAGTCAGALVPSPVHVH